MKRYLPTLVAGSLMLAFNTFAQDANTASGTMIIGKHNVAIKYVYLVSATEGAKKGRRLIFSTKDLGASIGEIVLLFAIGAVFGCAAGRVVFGIEVDDDALFAAKIGQANRLAVLIVEREVRRFCADSQARTSADQRIE